MHKMGLNLSILLTKLFGKKVDDEQNIEWNKLKCDKRYWFSLFCNKIGIIKS